MGIIPKYDRTTSLVDGVLFADTDSLRKQIKGTAL
jgi:hypothetical protein